MQTAILSRLQYVLVMFLAASRIPSVTAQTPNPDAQACQTASAIISICISASPELSTATAFSSTASCACYSSSSWAPGVFDNYHAACYAFYSTASPALVEQASSYFHGPIPSDPCSEAGNVLRATRIATDTTLKLPQTTDPANAPCRYVESVASSCARASPASVNTPGQSAAFPASCLCYGSAGTNGALTAWKPMVFDNSWAACINYFSTANPAQYTSITASPGFEITPCADAGDVRSASTTSSASSALSPPITTPTTGGSGLLVVGGLDWQVCIQLRFILH